LAVMHLRLKIPSFNRWQSCLSQHRTNAKKIGSAIGMAHLLFPISISFDFCFDFLVQFFFNFLYLHEVGRNGRQWTSN
jgi:hypothetical protein